MEIDASLVLSVISVTVALGGSFGAYYRSIIRNREDITALQSGLSALRESVSLQSESINNNSTEVRVLSNRIVCLETKVEVFWVKASQDLARFLHSPHTPELDVFLEKYASDTATPSDIKTLRSMLLDSVVSQPDSRCRKLAALLLVDFLDQRISNLDHEC